MPYQRPEDERDWSLLRRFGVEFRRCRHHAGLSQVELARRSGVSQSTISRIERGRASSAAMFKLAKVGHVLDYSFPFGFCPHPHDCFWNRLDEDGAHSLDPRRPIATDDYLESIRSGAAD